MHPLDSASALPTFPDIEMAETKAKLEAKHQEELYESQIKDREELIDNIYNTTTRERNALLCAHHNRSDSNPTSWNDAHFDESK